MKIKNNSLIGQSRNNRIPSSERKSVTRQLNKIFQRDKLYTTNDVIFEALPVLYKHGINPIVDCKSPKGSYIQKIRRCLPKYERTISNGISIYKFIDNNELLKK